LIQRENGQRHDGFAITFEVSCIRGPKNGAAAVGRRRETLDFISETEFHLAQYKTFWRECQGDWFDSSDWSIDNSLQFFHFLKCQSINPGRTEESLAKSR
jgi:hypothetical protein